MSKFEYDDSGYNTAICSATVYNPIHISKEFQQMNKGRISNAASFLVKYGRHKFLNATDSLLHRRQIAWFALLAKREIPLWEIPMRKGFVSFQKTVKQPILLNKGFKLK